MRKLGESINELMAALAAGAGVVLKLWSVIGGVFG